MPAPGLPSTERLVLLSRSGRALAESARRAGLAGIVIDAFADTDTRAAAARCVPVAWSERGPMGAQAALAATPDATGLVYGGGLESMPELLEPWFEAGKLFGNEPEVVRTVNDPARFSRLLDELGVARPELRLQPPAPGDGWLLKRAAASGGAHVRPWTGRETFTAQDYFQRRVEGPVMSVLFLADGQHFSLVGWNTQWTRAGDFVWGGAINRAVLSAEQRRKLRAAARSLVSVLELRGLNSLDFVLDDDEPVILELNPRPGATLELHDADFERGLLYWHLRSCAGRLPRAVHMQHREARASQVIYARQPLSIPADAGWPAWCHDLPVAGTLIAAGEPVCTLTVSDPAPSHALARLGQRALFMGRRLASFRRAA